MSDTYTEDKKFTDYVNSLTDSHWSKYDLAAVRLGWDAAMIAAEEMG